VPICPTRVTVTGAWFYSKTKGWLQMDGQRPLVISHLPKQKLIWQARS